VVEEKSETDSSSDEDTEDAKPSVQITLDAKEEEAERLSEEPPVTKNGNVKMLAEKFENSNPQGRESSRSAAQKASPESEIPNEETSGAAEEKDEDADSESSESSRSRSR
jgi:hypothetical protein